MALVPHLTRILDRNGREGFQIVDTRYVSISRRPELESEKGYIANQSIAVFTRDGVRYQLKAHFGLGEDEINHVLTEAPTVVGVIELDKGGTR